MAKESGAAAASDVDEHHDMVDGTSTTDDELRKMLAEIIVDNARLRKQVNSVIRRALKINLSNKEDAAV